MVTCGYKHDLESKGEDWSTYFQVGESPPPVGRGWEPFWAFALFPRDVRVSSKIVVVWKRKTVPEVSR